MDDIENIIWIHPDKLTHIPRKRGLKFADAPKLLLMKLQRWQKSSGYPRLLKLYCSWCRHWCLGPDYTPPLVHFCSKQVHPLSRKLESAGANWAWFSRRLQCIRSSYPPWLNECPEDVGLRFMRWAEAPAGVSLSPAGNGHSWRQTLGAGLKLPAGLLGSEPHLCGSGRSCACPPAARCAGVHGS